MIAPFFLFCFCCLFEVKVLNCFLTSRGQHFTKHNCEGHMVILFGSAATCCCCPFLTLLVGLLLCDHIIVGLFKCRNCQVLLCIHVNGKKGHKLEHDAI